MNIDELKSKHYQCHIGSEQHPNISIQFTIDVLEEIKAYYEFSNYTTVFVNDKIKELKSELE